MNKREFIRVGIAGAVGALFVPQHLMAGRVELALNTKLAGGVYYTPTGFGRWNKDVADHHLPMLEKRNTSLHVASGHPMDAPNHWIIKHQLLDSNFDFITEKLYDPTSDNRPATTFDISGRSGAIYVLTMCNVHDLWLNVIEV